MLMLTALLALSSFGTTASLAGEVRIVGMPGGRTQTLPGNYVRSFPRWFVDDSRGQRGGGDENSDSPSRHRRGLTAEPLRTAGDDTFVDPTSTSELWWPSDIEVLQIRPALDVLMKAGTPNYALAGLNVRVPGRASADGTEWRNYGLNSQPLAAQWMTFGVAVEGSFRVECFVGEDAGVGDDESMDDSGKVSRGSEGNNMKWKRLFPGNLGSLDDTTSAHIMFGAERMKKVVEALGMFLSRIDEASPLSDGFHVVSFPLAEDWIDLPKIEGGEEGSGYKLTCVATSEPDAKALLEMDRGLVEMTATSMLEVDVSPTDPGSDSDYLPDSYKPLYIA